MEEDGAKFKEKLVLRLLHHFFKDEKLKVNKDHVSLIAEYLTIFVREGAGRAVRESDNADVITVEHFEKILPQLCLDF